VQVSERVQKVAAAGTTEARPKRARAQKSEAVAKKTASKKKDKE
jgi:hypothetical protein